jgi:tetratricopeptide (TPR) repeat protein
VLALTGAYSLKTVARNPDWKNNSALFSHDVKVAPNSIMVHCNYGMELLFTLYPHEKNKDKQYALLNKALSEFTQAKNIHNDFPYAYSCLGQCYSYLEDYPNAISNYQTAIRLYYPSFPPDVFCNLGFVYSKTGQYEKALSILDSSFKYNPNYKDAYIKKSSYYIVLGKNNEAMDVCDKLLKLDSNNVYAYVNKGCALSNLGQYQQGIEYLQKALELDPKNADCMKFLGITYKNMGNAIKAAEYFEKEKQTEQQLL